ncbi:hypothetical protein SAMN04488589_1530 [Methanolobus vulcani]|uniref:Uncharacterized protein n=1 Tax=Methanolobus vulcani TaxID=38026 RepID=A0A7Z7AWL7_9EURY|nr:hypothetical protein [Methanolobus vulcani]SDF85328.1 hypothetical protein SAMN04488589_1530 [Methanolobus vulcani]
MAKTAYRIRENGGRLNITLPQKVAFALGIVDPDGNLVTECVKYELDMDDSGAYAILRPYEPNNG